MNKPELSDNDKDALPAVRTARTLAGAWPLVAGVCALIGLGATVTANVKANSLRIEQLETKRDSGDRAVEERLRRLEEGMATLLERTKGK